MQLGLAVVIFIIGIYLIIKGGDWFVESASWIAHAAKIPTFIVGATIVSFATTLPELSVSLIASINGQNDMAIGNAVGSVIANTGLIMAIAFTFMNVKTPRKNYWIQCLLLMISSIVLWLSCLGGTLSIWISMLLLLFYIIFITVNIIQGRHETLANQTSENETSQNKKNIIIITKKIIVFKILFFVLGAAFIICGSNFLINGGTAIAQSLGIPEHIIAITMVAVGTSLPELMTTIAAIRKKEGGLSVGNIIGANIMNLTLILSSCNLVALSSFSISTKSILIDFPFCFVLSLITIVPLLLKQRSYKWQGILMLLVYTAYLTVSVLI